MITLEHDHLVFRFPDVHAEARCAIELQRTLRIPDDDRDYPLPPGLGGFPVRHLDDYAQRVPAAWQRRGGVIAPLHQAEALWINFEAGYPCAVKVATGKICAITGDRWVTPLNTDPQDYVVLPDQPWLDGYCVETGVIRQFVAMPLGRGYTVEEQLTRCGRTRRPPARRLSDEAGTLRAVAGATFRAGAGRPRGGWSGLCLPPADPSAMGLAPGGRMRQEIYDDPHGLDVWDQRQASRCFVTLAHAAQWLAITGERPPTVPPTASEYTEAGLPWFEWYGHDASAVAGADTLAALASVHTLGAQKGEGPLPENAAVTMTTVVGLRRRGSTRVREYAPEDTGGS